MKARNSERFAALHCRSFSHTLRSWWQQSVRHGATMYQLSRLAAPVWSCESCIGGAFFLGPIISFAPKYLPPCFTKKKQKWLWTRKAIQKDPCTCLCRWGKGQMETHCRSLQACAEISGKIKLSKRAQRSKVANFWRWFPPKKHGFSLEINTPQVALFGTPWSKSGCFWAPQWES